MLKKSVVAVLFALTCSVLSSAQEDKGKRPSPPAQAQCKVSDGKTITVDYSSPRAKGRKIFGDLVPYGEVWRAGANEATTFVTTADLMVGGEHVPAGNYTLLPFRTKRSGRSSSIRRPANGVSVTNMKWTNWLA